MSLKKMLFIISIVIVVAFSLMLTTSYAWYSFNNASTSFNTVTTADLVDITYQTGEYINTTTAIPIKSSEVSQYADSNKFTLTSKNTDVNNELYATISLVNISIDRSLQSANFKVELYYQGSWVTTVAGNTIGTSGATTKSLKGLVLDDNISNNFEVRAYLLDDGTDQSNLMNKTFRAKIQIDVVSRAKVKLTKDNYDIYVSNITIDGTTSNSLPTGGLYNMTSSCEKGSTLSWEPYSKTLTYNGGSKIQDSCSLTFTKNTTTKKLLNTMPVGSYVKYEGTGGKVGTKSVRCKKGGSASSSTATAETEAPNSCLGQNAREDLDTSGYTYGYCYSVNYRYYTTGWRIGYIKDGKAMLVSAGSPECVSRTSIAANATYIQTANARAMKYCNSNYVDGNCTCTDSNSDGLCDSPSTDVWALGDTDFYYMTKAISGYGKRLTSGSESGLGDSGGSFSAVSCSIQYSKKECGYNNDLIDNGGYYWFAARYSTSGTSGVCWNPYSRYVSDGSGTNAYGSRFVISLKSSVYVTGGEGTMDDPYTISY